MGYVYLARNRINNKRYVGKTVLALWKRIAGHRAAVKRGVKHIPFAHALGKYGPEGFEWTVLFESDNNKKLLQVERAMIAMLRTKSPHGYNLTNGGQGSTGLVASVETRRKMSAVRKGKKLSPFSREARLHMSIAHLGKRHTAEQIKKIGDAHRGRKCPPLTAEHRDKLSKSHIGQIPHNKGRKASMETRAKLREAWKKRGPVKPETTAKRIATLKRNKMFRRKGTL